MNQRQLRLQALVQAPKKQDYPNNIYELQNISVAKQLESEYSFDGNWRYIWFSQEIPLEIGEHITLDKNYVVEEIHVYKNYKRGSMLLSEN